MSSLKDHRYRATILKIERTDGGEADFFDALVYHDLTYEEILGVQVLMAKSNVEALLTEAGIKTAKAQDIALRPDFEAAVDGGKSGKS